MSNKKGGSTPINLVWFRQDLRLNDNPALFEAAKNSPILPIYILDDCAEKGFRLGASTKLWLHHSLESLNASLTDNLNLYQGSAHEVIEEILGRYTIKALFFNLCFEPWHKEQERAIKQVAENHGVPLQAFNSCYLWHPDTVTKEDGSFYKVYSPYKKRAFISPPANVRLTPKKLDILKDEKASTLSSLNLIAHNTWSKALINQWHVGESAALGKLKNFIKDGLDGYKVGRDFPEKGHVSQLSPHLHFGEIAPVHVWHAAASSSAPQQDKDHFLSELAWREFSCYLMHHFPKLHKDNFNAKFDRFPWHHNENYLKAWQKGLTGYPIVDAGMRQLWRTGYMHNRVRMIVASFLIKNLGLHWHAGRDWFWDCLVDADLANNSASWQWVAGCGADAAPYFRIFNPILQGEKFDKEGTYTKKWVPELKNLPTKYLFKPWLTPEEVLEKADIELGTTYPQPLVDLAASREQALKYYGAL